MADTGQMPTATGADQFSMRVENALKILMVGCLVPAQVSDAPGKNAAMKVNLTLLNIALSAWVSAIATQIAAI